MEKNSSIGRRQIEKEMSDINNQIIYCQYRKASMTVEGLGEYVNANPETKKQAIEELQLWGAAYDSMLTMLQTSLFPFLRHYFLML